jgi:MFS family permease
MEFGLERGVDLRALAARPGFRWLFLAMFISLFGTGMTYAGTTWYILEQTGSTVKVSLMVILVTLPGLIVPPFGGVLIDRVDRRYLGMALDVARGGVVLTVAALGFIGRMELWHIYAMVALIGVGFAVYWSTTNALVQEVAGPGHLVGANAAVLIAVQGGMMTAGALVGFIYEHTGIAGILGIDGATYLVSAFCLLHLRRGYYAPHARPAETSPTIEAPAPAGAEQQAVLPPIVEPGIVMGFLADLKEGLRYLRGEARVFALGLTYACMMAGVISANVLVVVLARDILDAGPRGYGFIESGWAIGAITGGFLAGVLVRRVPGFTVLILALLTLALGHALFPYVRWLALAVAMNAVFGGCRALGGVLTQSSIMTMVPRRLMGRTQSAFSVLSTLMQVAMTFSLGWLAQHVSVPLAFATLGLLYGGATLAAVRARGLARPAAPALHPG